MKPTAPKHIDKGRLRSLVRAGWSDRRLAREFGVCLTTVAYHRRAFGLPPNRDQRRWTPLELETAALLRGRGRPLSHVGLAIGRTEGATREALARAGRRAA